jgi:CTP-dependent riboflavin kinase
MEQERDIGKLWGFARELKAWTEGKLRELEILFIGVDGSNGLRGDLRELKCTVNTLSDKIDDVEKEVKEAWQWGKDAYYIERHKDGQCIGKAALDKYLETQKKETESLKKARYALYTGLLVALVSAGATVYATSSGQETQKYIAEIQRDIRLIEIQAGKP